MSSARFAGGFLLFLLAILISHLTAVGADGIQEGERLVPQVKATRINPHPPKIDGNLDDAIWTSGKIDLVRSFTQREPNEGEAPSESTLVAITYDDEALYVAFWCYDSEPDKVDRQLVRRDRWSSSDRVMLRLDPYHDHQTGYGFEVSTAGVQRDTEYYNNDHSNYSWDAVWESASQLQPWGWSAEMKIPYHCLRFPAQAEHTWGIDFRRVVNRRDEEDRWAYTPVADGGFVSNFGHLVGLHGIEPVRHIEVMPYAVSSLETEPSHIGNPDGRNVFGNTGFDVKYALSTDLMLNATINPDFGQVELDAPILNLSTYETWFDEKRPFFLEGSSLFETDFTLFYSRRIGRAPWQGVDDDEAEYYTDYPKNTTILGAAKLSGKLTQNTSVAFMSAITEEESAEYGAITNIQTDTTGTGDDLEITTVAADTVIRKGVVDPRASYTALRVKRNVLRNSYVGSILTLVSQEHEDPELTGGVDWRLHTNSGNWMTRGQVIFSRTDYEKTGYGITAAIEKVSGQHVRGGFGTTIKNPDLDINRLGFTPRNNQKHAWVWLQYRTNEDWWIIRNSWNNFNFNTSRNYDDITYSLCANYNAHFDFTNFWSLGTGIEMQAEKYSDLETRGNGVWEWPVHPTFSWWASLNTDHRKSVVFNFNPGYGTDRGGSWWANYIGVDIRPRSNMEFSIGANYHQTINGTRWVENVDDSSMFAELNRDQLTLRMSAGIVFNPNLSFQLSARGLISGLDYSGYRFYQGNGSYGAYQSGNDLDRNWAALNSTALLRWEYLPGSTLYVVWTRSQSDTAEEFNDLDLSRDMKRMFSSNADNTFLVKASYWLNM